MIYPQIRRTLGGFYHRVTREGRGWQVYLSAARSGYEGSGVGGGEYIRTLPSEYRLPVYRHSANTGAMSGRVETTRGVGVNEMVGTGRTRTISGRVRYGEGYI